MSCVVDVVFLGYHSVLCTIEAGCFLNNEGSALYPLQSACNHSCTPNAMPGFPCDNFDLVMSATQDIAAGEQICVSYLDECALERSRHSRNKILR